MSETSAPATPTTTAPAGEPTQTNTDTPETPPEPSRRFKLQVDGKDVELEEKDLLAKAQMGYSAHQRWEQAAAKEKAVQQMWTEFFANPRKFLNDPEFKKRGFDFRKVAEEELYEQIEAEKMSPEARRAHEAEKELQNYKAQEQLRQRQEQQASEAAEVEKEKQEILSDFRKALDESGLPEDTVTVSAMAHLTEKFARAGVKVPSSVLAHETKALLTNNFRSVARKLKGQSLLDLLGPEILVEVRRAELARVRGTAVQPGNSARPATPPPTNGRGDPIKDAIARAFARHT